MTWNPRTWNKAIVKRAIIAAILFPPVVGFSNSPKHEKPAPPPPVKKLTR